MIKVLIPTRPDDAHALYVKLALENLGHQADLWFTADFPSLQTHCFELEAGKLRWRLRDRDYHNFGMILFGIVDLASRFYPNICIQKTVKMPSKKIGSGSRIFGR
jgi:hypothetical protein